MKLQKKYMLLKATTIALGAMSIPWGTFTGFCFGEGRYFTGLVSLCSQTVVALADGYIWFWVLENMRNRIQQEAEKQSGKMVVERGAKCPLLSETKPADSIILSGAYQFRTGERTLFNKIYSGREQQRA